MKQTSSLQLQQQTDERLKELVQIIRDGIKTAERLSLLQYAMNRAQKIVKQEEKFHHPCVVMILKLIVGEYNEVLKMADEILSQKQLYKIYFVKADALVLLDRIEDAIGELNKATQLKSLSRNIHRSLGQLYKKQNNLDEALHSFETAVFIKPDEDCEYQIGLIYQEKGDHIRALQNFSKVCNVKSGSEFYLSKMKSFEALFQYDEALECCDILIADDPEKVNLFKKKQKLLQLSGRIEDSALLAEQILLKNASEYDIESFMIKRDLSTSKIFLQKKQSLLKITNQSPSQVQNSKLEGHIKQYNDAIFYIITYFFVSFSDLKQDDDSKDKIGEYLFKKQVIKLNSFEQQILSCLKSLFPNINKLSQNEIVQNLNKWVYQKIQPAQKQLDIYEFLFKLFEDINHSNQMKNLINIRMTEEFIQSKQRWEQYSDLLSAVSCLSSQLKNSECTLTDSNAGMYGLEMAIILLAYMIIYSKLADDYEDLSTLIWRLFSQNDLYLLFAAESEIKKKTKKEQQGD